MSIISSVQTRQASTSQSLSSVSENRSPFSSSSASLSEEEWDWKIALPRSLRAELLDPFQTYPESRVQGVDVLMKYYLKTAVYKVFPWNPALENNPTTTYYVPLVWNDQVLFHATLQLSAMRLSKHRISQNVKLDSDTKMQLETECIRLLRDRVENQDLGKGVSDQTISAVATLAAIEHENGRMRMLKMHMNGLKRMVDVRGGLNAIRETSPMVANSVFWMFVVAIYEIPFPNLDPFLPPFLPSKHNLSHFQDFGPPTHESPLPLDLVNLGVVQPIALILNSVQHVSQLVPAFSSYPTAATSMVILTRMCALLSHLLSLPQIQSSKTADFSSVVSECTRYAILLHVFTPWRGLQPDGALTINHLLHQLIHYLKVLINFSEEQNMNNELVLWLFATGGVASLNMPERAWFVSHLAELTENMMISNWKDMKANVSRAIWHEKLCERVHKMLWDEVAAKRGLGEEKDVD